jgi:LSU ribosomal protein L11P methyltransferase (EC 2.1.1.-)
VSEIRLFVTTTEQQANRILDLMSFAFGEEDYAIATTEIDEKNDVWQASVYLMADEEAEVNERVVALLAEEFPDLPVEREVIPDIDWIAKSLERADASQGRALSRSRLA